MNIIGKIIMDTACYLQLPVKVTTDTKTERGFLSTQSTNPFNRFYLHEKPKKKFVTRSVMAGDLCDIKKISFSV